MGYRSGVNVVIEPDEALSNEEKQRVFTMLVGVIKLTAKEWLEETSKWAEIGWAQGTIRIHMEGVKFYDSYPEVKAFWDLWRALAHVQGANGHFMRVGEDYEDIETHTFGAANYNPIKVQEERTSYMYGEYEYIGNKRESTITFKTEEK